MGLILADVGADEVLNVYFNNAATISGGNLTLKLFVTNITPAQTNTAGSFVEATGGGYTAGGKTLTNGSWTVNAANDPSDAVYAEQTWTFTGALDTNPVIYGYYVVDASGVLVWSETLGATFTPANNGDQLKITPKFQMSSGTPA